ncbi:MAG: ABC transporter ATP-binding protein [Alphaproteobacteria bacterium]|nr:ABC transporter ATP-binding protein [Alphaproteobacteria bacterium]
MSSIVDRSPGAVTADTPRRAAGPTIDVHAARLVFGSSVLFDALDLSLAGGQWTCILGPSGVGKSSLIRIVAGLERGAAGTRIAARDGRDLDGRIAWMAQQDLLFPWARLAANVAIGARLRASSSGDHGASLARARALLAEVGLGAYADAYPATCSGGMRQRAAIARTLFEDRPIVLMDEPFSALDAVTRLRLQELAAAMLAGRTVLLVTHDPLEALRLGHRIHVMAGRPARLGAPLEPAGTPPRDPGDPALLALQAELLGRLRAADDQT